MSNKDAVINLIRRLPDDVSLREILTHLERKVASTLDDWSAEELTEEEWRQFVAYGLRNELADEREDIYGRVLMTEEWRHA